jgi:hypothetical protein
MFPETGVILAFHNTDFLDFRFKLLTIACSLAEGTASVTMIGALVNGISIVQFQCSFGVGNLVS